MMKLLTLQDCIRSILDYRSDTTSLRCELTGFCSNHFLMFVTSPYLNFIKFSIKWIQ